MTITATPPATPATDPRLAPDVIKDFGIRTRKGLWKFVGVEERDGETLYLFDRSGAGTRWLFRADQLLDCMSGGRLLSYGELQHARPDWYAYEARVRDEQIMQIRAAMLDGSHPHASLVARMEEAGRTLAEEGATYAEAVWNTDERRRPLCARIIATLVCPAVSTWWLCNNGDLNNGNVVVRAALNRALNITLPKTATNKRWVETYHPLRVQLIGAEPVEQNTPWFPQA